MKEIEQVLGRVRPGQASVDDVTVSMNAILVPSGEKMTLRGLRQSAVSVSIRDKKPAGTASFCDGATRSVRAALRAGNKA